MPFFVLIKLYTVPNEVIITTQKRYSNLYSGQGQLKFTVGISKIEKNHDFFRFYIDKDLYE